MAEEKFTGSVSSGLSTGRKTIYVGVGRPFIETKADDKTTTLQSVIWKYGTPLKSAKEEEVNMGRLIKADATVESIGIKKDSHYVPSDNVHLTSRTIKPLS